MSTTPPEQSGGGPGGVGAHDWVVATTWLTAAYLISRGIAKASRVLEQ